MLAASFIDATLLGQLVIGILVAVVGLIINHKTTQIHVLVNSQMSTTLKRIDALEKKLNLARRFVSTMKQNVKTMCFKKMIS